MTFLGSLIQMYFISCRFSSGLQVVEGMVQAVPTDSNHVVNPPRPTGCTLRSPGDQPSHRGDPPLQALGPGPPPPSQLNSESSEYPVSFADTMN